MEGCLSVNEKRLDELISDMSRVNKKNEKLKWLVSCAGTLRKKDSSINIFQELDRRVLPFPSS